MAEPDVGRGVDRSRLATERERIRQRRELFLEGQLRQQALRDQASTATVTPYRRAVIRCDQPHRKKGWPKLAQAVDTGRGWFFVSRIQWLPGDELNLRPWERQYLEGPGMDEPTFELAMSDDAFLGDLLLHHDQWAEGIQEPGERWLRKAPDKWLVLPVIPDLSLDIFGLWVRCKDHPEHAEAIEPSQILTA
jgi:hypothetical protein